MMAFVNALEKKYTVPLRSTMTRLLRSTYNDVSVSIKTMITQECNFYALTSDIWSSRTSEAYISLMVHYLTKSFTMKVITLRCAPFSNVRHTGAEIAKIIKESLEDAGMCLDNLVVYVTDNASNAIKSAKDLGVKHQGCVAHLLNLIVQKLVRWKLTIDNQPTLDGISKHLHNISKSIEIVRDYVKYLSSSTIGSEWLKKSMERSNENPRSIPLDVITRWNSTLYMLKIATKLRVHLDAFCSYIYTEEGRAAFSNCSKITQISHEQWFLLQNICKLLDLFDLATKALSGEKYPTWALTLPVLREIKHNLMAFEVTGGVAQADWYEYAKTTVIVFRDELLKEFKGRFQQIDMSLLWTILLDPRLTTMNGFSDEERNKAKTMLLHEMKKASKQETCRKKDMIIELTEDDHTSNMIAEDNYILGSIFSRSDAERGNDENDNDYSHEKELETYLTHCKNSKIRVPLNWGCDNQESYPTLAWLSRKWLCAVSTSVSSERLFSRTGATVTSRRARLKDDHVEMLTFVHDNLKYI